MKNPIRSSAVLAAVAALTIAVGIAQSSGEAVYKEKCLNCHGPNGLANSGVGKIMKVKPITDPDVKKLSAAEMIEMTRSGVGKMQPYKGELPDSEIKAAVIYFRSFVQ
jgi:mono/diheme cytochrome c family protein